MGACLQIPCSPSSLALFAPGTRPSAMDDLERHQRLVATLRQPHCYPHPVQEIRVVETHISSILLTGPYAYKLKKPVDLGFLDFSTAERRAFFCKEELRLNRRLAPELYLDVVTVNGNPESPRIQGDGPVLEHAVKIRQFPDQARLDRIAEQGELTPGLIDTLARRVAEFHATLPAAPTDSPFGTAEGIEARVLENFRRLRDRLPDADCHERVTRLEAWSRQTLEQHREEFEQRRREGWVRACHGDLHLANMALLDGRPVLFDCLEFSQDLRWIDTMSEVAFVCMDLAYRGLHALSWRFLNQHLFHSADYMGLSLLRHYLVYRAMVRAKVSAIRLQQSGEAVAASELRRYLRLAQAYTEAPARTPIVILHGLSGSGKSWLAERLAEAGGAIHIRSDIERKRLLGLPPEASTAGAGMTEAYSPQVTQQTYQRLQALAFGIVDAGFPVIVDATFLHREQREGFFRLARVAGVPALIVDVEAPDPVVRERIARRLAAGGDPSEATVRVYEHQKRSNDPLDETERRSAIPVNTDQYIDFDRLTQQVFDKSSRPA